MTASLAKKVTDLEATFWAKAKPITLSIADELVAYTKATHPLDTRIFDEWFKSNAEAAKLDRRMGLVIKGLPPVHPAFLPDYDEGTREHQWALHHSTDYRESIERLWTQFVEFGRSHYDISDGGLLGVSLRLFEKDIDKWQTQREYIGKLTRREEMASEQIELWKIIRRKIREMDDPRNQEVYNSLWRQAIIETILYLYGRRMTESDLELEQGMWKQLDKDMAAGKPASESEAAAYLGDLIDRYPRKENY